MAKILIPFQLCNETDIFLYLNNKVVCHSGYLDLMNTCFVIKRKNKKHNFVGGLDRMNYFCEII